MNFDYNYIYNQSGVIPFKYFNGELKILLITSRKKNKWIFPKGIVELEMTEEESAIDEAYEEAGIYGKIVGDKLGSYKVQKWGGTCTVKMYPFEVEKILESWPESYFRKRKWVSVEEAENLIKKKEVINMLQKLSELLNKTV